MAGGSSSSGGGGSGRGGSGGGGGDRIRRQRRRERTPAHAGQRLHKRRGRKASSRQWLERQLNDPYVTAAKHHGYRSRAAFKLAQIADKHRVFEPGDRVVDLGAAPGGWAQIAKERVGGTGSVIALDILEIAPLPDITILQDDITADGTAVRVRNALPGAQADVVLSDMAPNTTGHRPTDRLRILTIIEAALDLAEAILAPGGRFLAKTLTLGGDEAVMSRLRREFDHVRFVKPAASRPESAETYVLATRYRGGESQGTSK
jgi:23S rRNA (uridine2552-2'-O)-methyltransferase